MIDAELKTTWRAAYWVLTGVGILYVAFLAVGGLALALAIRLARLHAG